MRTDQRQLADARLDEALESAGVRDPRDIYRERLKLLRDRDQGAFAEARRYYEDVLVPRVADPASDPVLEWFEYGRKLVELEGDGAPGRVVVIDRTGNAIDFTPPLPRDRLILHLPADPRAPVFTLNTPRNLSPAQQATYTLLVERKLRLADS